jgi:hypothetical protein
MKRKRGYTKLSYHKILDFYLCDNMETFNFKDIEPESWGKITEEWHFYAHESYTLEKQIIKGSTYIVKKVYEREVIFSNGKITKVIPISKWQGYWLILAGLKAGILKEDNSQKKVIQMNSSAKVEELESVGNIKVYKLSIGSLFWQYAVEKLPPYTGLKKAVIYHAHTMEEALSGLEAKLILLLPSKKVLKFDGRKSGNIITREDCLALGFCKNGIDSFCNDYGISEINSIGAVKLLNIVKKKPFGLAMPYLDELQVIMQKHGVEL